MSPRGAVLGLAIASAISISAIAILAPLAIALSLIGSGLAASTLLNNGYARGLATTRRPRSRVPLDRLVTLEAAAAFVLPLIVASLLEADVIEPIRVEPLLAASVSVVAGVMTVCFLSSLIDWYYVLPRRDGLIGEPPCRAPQQTRWQRVTWFWFLHRFVAAVATIGGVYAIAICLGLWLYDRYPDFAGGIGGPVPILAGVVTFFGRSYLRDIGHVWRLLFSPSAALGEHLETKEEGQSVSGYVLNVSIERVDLLHGDDVLTHASHGAIAKNCRHDSRASLCQGKCVRGNADATGKAPTGGHGGCLFETEERFLEDPVRRPRVFVF